MSNSRHIVIATFCAALAACGGGGNDAPRNKAPVAGLVISPSSGPAPLAINASGSTSSDADGTIATYAWDFGDGGSATGVAATHSYANPGEYVVKLTVTDDQGATGSATGRVVATGTAAAYDASLFDGTTYLEEPTSGTLDSTVFK
jgi:PKD repeat protein